MDSANSIAQEERTTVFIPDDQLVWVVAVVETVNEDNGSYDVDIIDPEYQNLRAPSSKKTVYLKDLPRPLEMFPLHNMRMPKEGVNNMSELNYLHEASILDNLHRRFKLELPYTYTGSICVAINPYQWLPIYTDNLQEDHILHFRHELPPHVYSSSSSAYRGVRDYGKDQSILVSGESGAGKTETVKILMGHIAYISGKRYDSTVEKVLKANHLLESFGNAKTSRNDNSSRFGKFTQLQFDEFAKLVGSKCVTYLLEKSRVVKQSTNERNYHIFYELLSSSEGMKKSLDLGGCLASNFVYMSSGDTKTISIEGRTDAQRFEETVETLELLGVSKEHVLKMWEILAGIIHLGQLKFIGVDEARDTSMVDPMCTQTTEIISKLFGIECNNFLRGMTTRHIEVVGEEMEVPLSVDQACDVRDALAKEIYTRIFHWLVGIVNSSTATYGQIFNTISLLDIFGFESFQVNCFEQLCINYANEKLQQKFTQDVFQAVQLEYQSEGLQWENIAFKDNLNTLELIEGKPVNKIVGIMSLLNEECVMPMGNDANLLAKLKRTCKDHSSFSCPLTGGHGKDEFTISHYAGTVSYNIRGFVDRNKDTLANETQLMMMESCNAILSDLFKDSTYVPHTTTHADLSVAESGKANRRSSFFGGETVVTKFKGQLNTLMQTFKSTEVQYVRCIKPNSLKIKALFDRKMVVEQLRCAGMIDAIRITRASYPYRVLQSDFITRFSSLKSREWNRTHCSNGSRLHCVALLESLIVPPDFLAEMEGRLFEVGKSRVYFSSTVLEYLELLRSRQIYGQIELIQKVYRGSRIRFWYLRVRAATITIQSFGRMVIQKSRLEKISRCIVSMQCAYRRKLAMRVLAGMRYICKVEILQASIRMFMQRSWFRTIRKSAVRIGSWARTCLQVKLYQKLRRSHQEQTVLTDKLKALRNKLRIESFSDLEKVSHPPLTGNGNVQDCDLKVGDEVDDDEGVLSSLQQEIEKLRDENECLTMENSTLKSSGRKEHFDLDTKIALMSVGKSTIQTLEKEREMLIHECAKSEIQMSHLKTEKQHVLDSLLQLSEEADMVNRKTRTWKRLYDTERAIRLSQILREREIMKHIRNLLRRRGVDYQQITDTKCRVSDTLHLNAYDKRIMWQTRLKKQLHGGSEDDERVAYARPCALSGRRGLEDGNINRPDSTESDVLSWISSVTTHRNSVNAEKRRTQTASDSFTNSPRKGKSSCRIHGRSGRKRSTENRRRDYKMEHTDSFATWWSKTFATG